MRNATRTNGAVRRFRRLDADMAAMYERHNEILSRTPDIGERRKLLEQWQDESMAAEDAVIAARLAAFGVTVTTERKATGSARVEITPHDDGELVVDITSAGFGVVGVHTADDGVMCQIHPDALVLVSEILNKAVIVARRRGLIPPDSSRTLAIAH